MDLRIDYLFSGTCRTYTGLTSKNVQSVLHELDSKSVDSIKTNIKLMENSKLKDKYPSVKWEHRFAEYTLTHKNHEKEDSIQA